MAIINNPVQNYEFTIAEGAHQPFTITDPNVSGIQTLVEWTTFGGTAQNVTDFSVSPSSASNYISVSAGGSFVIDVTAIADGIAESAEDFSFSYTIKLQGLGNTVYQTTNVHFIIAASSAGVAAPLPSVPTNADLKASGPGTYVSGSFHQNANGSWFIDDRVASAGDDQSFYSGTSLASLTDVVSTIPARFLVTRLFSDLASAPQRARDFFDMEYRHSKILFDLHVARPLSGDLFNGSLDGGATRDAALEAEVARYQADHAAYLAKYGNVAAAAAAEAAAANTASHINSTTNSFTVGVIEAGSPIIGTARSDEIVGGAGSDVIRPSSGTDYVNAGAGNDRIYVSADGSNDYLNGANGLDAVTFDGSRASVQVTFASGRVNVRESSSSSSDTLVNVERVQFNDSVLALDIQGNAGNAYRLYQAAFDRVPDQAGLSFWTHQLDLGLNIFAAAQGFVNAAEFRSVYGTNPTNTHIVDLMYQNVLGRAGEPAGINFWVGQLNRGLPVGELLQGFATSSENHGLVDPTLLMGITLNSTAFLV